MIDKSSVTIRRMFAEIAPRYDLANRVLSLSIDTRWRRLVAQRLLDAPGLVLDLAAGTGDLTVDLVRYGRHRVLSVDFTYAMLERGRQKLRDRAPAARQLAADALELPFPPKRFDGVTIAFGVRNFADALAGLRECRRVLKEGGACGVLEFSRPGPLLNAFYQMYSQHVLPRLGGMITGSRAPYEYLPQSVREFPEGGAFLQWMRDAGFKDVSAVRLSGGIATFYRGMA